MPEPTSSSLLQLQRHLQGILQNDGWFQPPVGVFVEDKAGLEYMLTKALAPLSAPVVIIMTASGEAAQPAAGVLNLIERVNVYFIQTPLSDKTGRVLLDGVERAMHLFHEASVLPGNPDAGPRIYVTGHGTIEGAHEAQLAHEVRLALPVQIAPASI